MEAALLRQLVAVESAPAHIESMPLRPQKSVTKTYPAVPSLSRRDDGTSIEMSRMARPATHTGEGHYGEHHNSYPATPVDLEMSRPASPVTVVSQRAVDDGTEALQNMWDPYMNRFRLLSACLINLVNGMSDSASGPLLPYMERHYNIGYAVVSLLFVGQAVGFIMGAAIIDPLRARLGRGRALALSQIFMVAGYVTMASTVPFPAIVVALFLIGLGMSINLALGNIFCGSLTNATTALGAMHGAYGIGGITGPLLANAFVTAFGLVWSRYYLLTLVLTVFNGFLALWSYARFEAEQETDALPNVHTTMTTTSASAAAASKLRTLKSALTSRVVVLGALFIFAYQGAEVSISGWVISFLEDTRGGDPDRVGYVTSGFWAGITLGRFVLSGPAHRIGEKRFVYGVVVGAAVLELLVWLVPNIIGNAVAVAIVGLLLGPIYPAAVAVFMRTMSRTEKLSGLGVVSAFGSSGGAAAPFTTGLLSQVAGTFVLHPIAIGLFAMMLVAWYGLPSQRKRRE